MYRMHGLKYNVTHPPNSSRTQEWMLPLHLVPQGHFCVRSQRDCLVSQPFISQFGLQIYVKQKVRRREEGLAS